MDTGFKIFIYFTLFVIWIISLINKFYKKNPKIKEVIAMPVNPSTPKTNSVTAESQPSKVIDTEKNPYSESVEYRKQELGRKYQERMLSKKKERVNTETEESVPTSTVNVDRINWKQAIIHSEILNRRF